MMSNTPKKRRWILTVVTAVIHLVLTSTVTLAVLAASMKPIGNPSDDWLVIPLLVLLFPTFPIALFAGFALPVLLILIPATSLIWGVTVGWVYSLFTSD